MKYDLDPELKKVAWIKAPSSLRMYSLANLALRAVPCRSDSRVTVRKVEIPACEGASIPAYVIEPRGPSFEVLPCVVFYHGGGFLLHASVAHYRIAKWYAEKANCRVVFPDYRLAPKYKFPVPVEDCYHACTWVLDHAGELAIDPDRIILTGDSAGGNLAASVTLVLRDRLQISPRGVMLIYPVADRRMTTQSMKKFQDSPMWDARLTATMWQTYLGDEQPQNIQYASPMESDTLSCFPDTYIEVAEFDSLHDEGIALAEKLRADGVSVELHEVSGACHGFETALRSRVVKEAMRRRIRWMRSVLGA